MDEETPGRDDYYDAALINIIVFCNQCQQSLDPDKDLGPDKSFHSYSYYVLLGDEAYRRGWKIEGRGNGDFLILCPNCAIGDKR